MPLCAQSSNRRVSNRFVTSGTFRLMQLDVTLNAESMFAVDDEFLGQIIWFLTVSRDGVELVPRRR
jgi:hypothetical protein